MMALANDILSQAYEPIDGPEVQAPCETLFNITECPLFNGVDIVMKSSFGRRAFWNRMITTHRLYDLIPAQQIDRRRQQLKTEI
jgi:hypothetical protein